MKDIILLISLALNVLVACVIGWFVYQGINAYKSAHTSLGTSAPGTIIEVIDVNDGGHRSLNYIVDYGGMKIVVDEYGATGTPKVAGDSVNVQVMKNDFGGTKTVNYSIVP